MIILISFLFMTDETTLILSINLLGTAKTAYSVKACLDTFKSWSEYAPIVQVVDIDMGDFPKDNNQAMEAMLQDLAIKTNSDWYDLQSPSSPSSSAGANPNRRASSISSTGTMSPRNSMSSVMTTTTYVDGVPMVQVINEIPPTPELEDGPKTSGGHNNNIEAVTSAPEPITIFVAGDPANTTDGAADARPTVMGTPNTPPSTAIPEAAQSSHTSGEAASPNPFIPKTTYTPVTSYQQGESGSEHGQTSSPPSGRTSRPTSGDLSSRPHLPHPLMMQRQPSYPPHQQQQQQQPPYPSGNGSYLPAQMPMPMPMQMPMPVPYIPDETFSSSSPPSAGGRRSQPITVSFPGNQPTHNVVSPPTLSSSSTSSPPSRTLQPQHPRNPQAIISSTKPTSAEQEPFAQESTSSSRRQSGFESDSLASHPSSASIQRRYDGPPPDYAEASMKPPAEKLDQKRRL